MLCVPIFLRQFSSCVFVQVGTSPATGTKQMAQSLQCRSSVLLPALAAFLEESCQLLQSLAFPK